MFNTKMFRKRSDAAIAAKKIGYSLILTCLALLFISTAASAADSVVLDKSFGSGGIAFNDFGECCATSMVRKMAMQPDGKIVVSGWVGAQGSVVRFNADGTPDATFGTGGAASAQSSGDALGIQPDGKIVVAGSYISDFSIQRFNADGSLDATFGAGGTMTTDFGGRPGGARALAIQPDGKIIVIGSRVNNGLEQILLARYNADGSLDATFGAGGKIVMPNNNSHARPLALALLGGGKFLVAGTSYNNSLLYRFNANGELDADFGTGGAASPVAFGIINSIAVQPNGKIVAVGGTYNMFAANSSNFFAARFNADGSLDTSFGAGSGSVVTDLGGNDAANAVAVSADGKILAAGAKRNSYNIDSYALVRYAADGALDTEFGDGGKKVFYLADHKGDANAILLRDDGKFIIGGFAAAAVNSLWKMMLARFVDYEALTAHFANQITALTTNNAALQTEIGGLQAEINRNQTQIADLQSQISNLQSQISTQTTTISNLQNQVSALMTQNSQLQTQTATLTQQNAQLQNAVNNLIAGVQNDFRQTFGDSQFTIPGTTPVERLQNLLNAIRNMNRGSKQNLHRNLGGR